MFLSDNSTRRQSFEYSMPQNVLKKSTSINSGDGQFQTHYVSPNHMSTIGNSPRPARR